MTFDFPHGLKAQIDLAGKDMTEKKKTILAVDKGEHN